MHKLNQWCKKWRLCINQSKTKILHFRNQSKARSDYVFKCGDTIIEYDSCYKYLGFWMNEYLDISKSIREFAKSASRALGAVYAKYLSAGGMSYDVYTKLINSIVEPVLFYGAGIWGQRYYNEIEVVLNKACRYFLGTTKNASNIATRGDMGWVSCAVKQKLETIRLWCRLKQMPENRLSAIVHKWSFNIGKSWEKTMLSFIAEYNLETVMLVTLPDKRACLSLARLNITDVENAKWREKLMNDGTDQNGNKLRTYRKYKTTFEVEHYVKTNMSRGQRKAIAKFRSCNLPLEIEKGRYTRPKTPVTERICKYCDSHNIEDETHFLINCSFYDDIRYGLFQLSSQINPSFANLTSDEKLVFIMQNNVVQSKLASCLLKMIKRRNTTSV